MGTYVDATESEITKKIVRIGNLETSDQFLTKG